MSDSFATPWTSSLPGSSVDGISQARILEQIAILFSRSSSLPRDQTRVFCNGRQILYHWATRDFNIFSSKCFLQNFLSLLIMCRLGSFWLQKPKPMKSEEAGGAGVAGVALGNHSVGSKGTGSEKKARARTSKYLSLDSYLCRGRDSLFFRENLPLLSFTAFNWLDEAHWH